MMSESGTSIAIVGMAGRFPGAASLAEFWANLRYGVEAISFFTAEELETDPLDMRADAGALHVPACGVLEGAEEFDAEFFAVSPREAELIDPQQRVFLECAWEALEQAGYDVSRYEGVVGLYAG